MANDQLGTEFLEKKFISSSSVGNPVKEKETEEPKQKERHFEDEEIYFKQVNLFSYHIHCFFWEDQQNTCVKDAKKWLKRKFEWVWKEQRPLKMTKEKSIPGLKRAI